MCDLSGFIFSDIGNDTGNDTETTESTYSVYKVLTCPDLIFKLESITENYGSIILLICLLINIIFLIIYIIQGLSSIKVNIAKLLFGPRMSRNIIEEDRKETPPSAPPRKSHAYVKRPQLESQGDNVKNKKRKSVKHFSKKDKKSKSKSLTSGRLLSFGGIRLEPLDDKKNGFELNRMTYLRAIEFDNRGLCEMYSSILKRDHILIFVIYSFWENDYNLAFIKFSRFFFLISTIFAMNVIIFYDEKLIKVLMANGDYEIVEQIPLIIFSSLVPVLFDILACFLSLTDKYIYRVKDLEHTETNQLKALKMIRKIKIKMIFYFVYTFILMIFFWYFVTGFSTIYHYAQNTYLINCALSLVLYMVYPFIIYFIFALIRYISLQDREKKGRSCLYKFGNFIPLI